MHFAARRVAGAGAASAALWYVAAAPQEDRRAREEESCRKLGLMLPSEAQRTAVARIPGFLSARECDDVRDVVRGLKCATIERSAGACSRPADPPRARVSRVLRRRAQAGSTSSWAPGRRRICTRTTSSASGSAGCGAGCSPRPSPSTAGSAGGSWTRRRTSTSARPSAFRSICSLDHRAVDRRYHQYQPGGGLRDARHYDAGSLITMDLMLAAPGADFEGGAFVTPEADGCVRGVAFLFGSWTGAAGPSRGTRSTRATSCSSCPTSTTTCVIFLLAFLTAPLQVEPVTRGTRVVLVAELWRGPEKTCAHRCQTLGACGHSLAHVRAGRAALEAGVLG